MREWCDVELGRFVKDTHNTGSFKRMIQTPSRKPSLLFNKAIKTKKRKNPNDLEGSGRKKIMQVMVHGLLIVNAHLQLKSLEVLFTLAILRWQMQSQN